MVGRWFACYLQVQPLLPSLTLPSSLPGRHSEKRQWQAALHSANSLQFSGGFNRVYIDVQEGTLPSTVRRTVHIANHFTLVSSPPSLLPNTGAKYFVCQPAHVTLTSSILCDYSQIIYFIPFSFHIFLLLQVHQC